MSEFSHLIELASERLGGAAVAANDDFFAAKENLVKAEPPVFIPGKYTDRGKWMDGWESRRRRTPGHDWCIVKLGLPGVVHSFVVDTAFFTGNYPTHCWIEGCGLPDDADPTAEDVAWHMLLPRSELAGDTRNVLHVERGHAREMRLTHLRLNIFPDGGVARLRVMGEVLPAWTRVLSAGSEVDLAAAVNGGYIVDTSDRFYGDARNMLMPYRALNMGDGWETKRRRGPGHDWTIVHLGLACVLRRIEIDTAHFKGNYPDSASVEAAVLKDEQRGVSADVAMRAIADWRIALPQTRLQPDHLHTLEADADDNPEVSHVRLNIFPDGGVSRFRVFGTPVPDARRAAVLRQLNAMDDPELRGVLRDFCAAPSWVEHLVAARPFASAAAVFDAAEAAHRSVSSDEWLEAFRHHPRIGEPAAERTQSEVARAASLREQAGVSVEDRTLAAALAEANRAYEQRFGHVFLVRAAGRSAGEILDILRERLKNDPREELAAAAEEHRQITRLRLERVLQ